MNATDQRRASVFRQVKAYEESWKQAHQEAMLCRDFEDTLAVGSAVFHLLDRTLQSWRDRVFGGAEEYDTADNDTLQSLLRLWLNVTEALLLQLGPLTRRFGHVDGGEELRRCVEQATIILRGWVPPRLSSAVGLREMELSPEAAADLKRLLAEAEAMPREEPPRPQLEAISAAEYLRRQRAKNA